MSQSRVSDPTGHSRSLYSKQTMQLNGTVTGGAAFKADIEHTAKPSSVGKLPVRSTVAIETNRSRATKGLP